MAAGLLLLAGCGSGDVPATTDRQDGLVTTLAKLEGHAPGAVVPAFATLEIAHDAAGARSLWTASGVEALPERDGEPRGAGRYAALDDVDFDEQVVALWSSGQSGSCPGWLAGVGHDGDRLVLLTDEHAPTNACTDDYDPYRTVVALPRDAVPTPEVLDAAPEPVRALVDPRPQVTVEAVVRRWSPP